MRARARARRALGAALATIAAAAALVGWLPASAAAGETASLRVSFTPERLGQSTTINFGFQIAGEGGASPAPLTRVDLSTPAGLSYLTSTLGLAVCEPQRLVRNFLHGCPANSRVGSGSAQVAVPIGPGAGTEAATVAAYMGRPQNGKFTVIFTAVGRSPVAAQIFFAAEWEPGGPLSAGSLDTSVPLVPTVPGGPDVAIVSARASIGPGDFLYVKRVHRRLVHFRPRGVSLPERCPRGGFPFQALFEFADGSSTSAAASVPCPPPRR